MKNASLLRAKRPFSLYELGQAWAGESVRLTAAQSIMTYAGGNYVIASDAAMILRAGASEIILRPDGEISSREPSFAWKVTRYA